MYTYKGTPKSRSYLYDLNCTLADTWKNRKGRSLGEEGGFDVRRVWFKITIPVSSEVSG